jgi:hypothetical protein
MITLTECRNFSSHHTVNAPQDQRGSLVGCGFAAPVDNLTVDHQALGQAALAHNSDSPNSNEGILFLAGMKEKSREDCRVSGTSSAMDSNAL